MGEKAESAAGTEETTEITEEETQATSETTEETQEETQEEMVPLSALQGVRDDLKSMRQANSALSDQLKAVTPVREAPKGPLSHLNDTDVITVGEVKQLVGAAMGTFSGTLSELQMQQQYPDYQDVIKDLPALAEKIPGLRDTVARHDNPYLFAYTLANQFREKDSKVAPIPPTDPAAIAAKVKVNLEKPISSSTSAAASVSEVNRIAAMSSDEFQAHVENVKAGRN